MTLLIDNNYIQQLVDKLYKSMSCRHNFILFREFANNEEVKWKLLEGTQVKHKDLGPGTVTKVYKGNKGDTIFIHINFPHPRSKEKPCEVIFLSKEFTFTYRSGLTELIIPSTISAQFDKIWQEIDKKRTREQSCLQEQVQRKKQEVQKEQALKQAKWKQIAEEFKKLSTLAMNKIVTDFSLPEVGMEDLKLVCQWANLPHHEHTTLHALKTFLLNSAQQQTLKQNLERLISARMAEKVTLEFYTKMDLHVEDVSVTQITSPQGGDWQYFDLRVGSDEIDVKNARPHNYKNKHPKKYSYAELRIKKFGKINPDSHHTVDYAGVLSPNFSLENFLEQKTIPSYYNHLDITFLGTVKFNQIRQLKKEFTMPGLEIDFSRIHYKSQQFLPKWIFDYPIDSYRIRNENLKRIENIIWPNEGEFWDEHPLNLAPSFLALGKDYTRLRSQALNDYGEICFVEKVLTWRSHTPLSLPFIFVTVLWHFVKMAQQSNAEWHPVKYRSLLFCNEKTDKCWPLFVYDPQETVNDLITTLESLWDNRQAVIQKFRQFKLTGAGILRGRRTSQERWQTLVAYCGECYNHPLIWDDDNDCQKCGRLHCDRCGYCSDECRASNMDQEQVNIG